MKVLILSCKTGGGHDAAGFAMKEALEAHGHEAVMFDYLTLANPAASWPPPVLQDNICLLYTSRCV